MSKIYLYAEIQVSIPFSQIDWPLINEAMKKERGLKSKTWLSGVNTRSIGGFYEFDSLETAKAYATGYLAAAAGQLGGSLTVRLFDGDIVEDASKGMDSPFYRGEPRPLEVAGFEHADSRRPLSPILQD